MLVRYPGTVPDDDDGADLGKDLKGRSSGCSVPDTSRPMPLRGNSLSRREDLLVLQNQRYFACADCRVFKSPFFDGHQPPPHGHECTQPRNTLTHSRPSHSLWNSGWTEWHHFCVPAYSPSKSRGPGHTTDRQPFLAPSALADSHSSRLQISDSSAGHQTAGICPQPAQNRSQSPQVHWLSHGQCGV
ncbi:hypothetical protein LZ30DRAFT_298382 [Colletotrichum cereale]|nr:hypothetical protein LZ30DRAFT_298382 [Colletotrichum cereale]